MDTSETEWIFYYKSSWKSKHSLEMSRPAHNSLEGGKKIAILFISIKKRRQINIRQAFE